MCILHLEYGMWITCRFGRSGAQLEAGCDDISVDMRGWVAIEVNSSFRYSMNCSFNVPLTDSFHFVYCGRDIHNVKNQNR